MFMNFVKKVKIVKCLFWLSDFCPRTGLWSLRVSLSCLSKQFPISLHEGSVNAHACMFSHRLKGVACNDR